MIECKPKVAVPMIKVVHVINQAREGGGLEHVLALLNELRGSDFKFFVATSGPDFMLERIKQSGAEVITMDFMNSRINPFPSIRLARLVRRIDADILHLHGTRAAFFGIPARKTTRAKSIYTVHVLSYHKLRSKNNLVSVPYIWAERACCSVHDRVIAISRSYASELVKQGICAEDKVVTIPNGVTYSRLRHVDKIEARQALGLSTQKLWVGVAARLVPQKGVEHIVDAARILRDRNLSICVAIAGDGELRDRLERMVNSLGLGESVVFCGHQIDIARFLSAIDVFVLPSLWEGLPLTLLEAMAMGLICVATDVDGVREVIEHGRTGLLVPPGDFVALANTIQAVFSDLDKFGYLGEAARESVKKYSWKESAARTAEIYRELAGV